MFNTSVAQGKGRESDRKYIMEGRKEEGRSKEDVNVPC
jgi:hypothetical protein